MNNLTIKWNKVHRLPILGPMPNECGGPFMSTLVSKYCKKRTHLIHEPMNPMNEI